MPKDLMFSFVADERPNPLGGKCYGCTFCYIHGIKGMKIRFKHIRDKYSGGFRLYPKILERIRNIRSDKLTFFCDCIDYMHENNTDENIIDILYHIRNNRYNVDFLSLTRNPERYIKLIKYIPENMILGYTIESDINYSIYSGAPLQSKRIQAIKKLNLTLEYLRLKNKTLLCIEPILKFNFDVFLNLIEEMNPTYGIVIGYDNHHNKLDEPSLKETLSLRSKLISYGFKVIDKTLRKAWWE